MKYSDYILSEAAHKQSDIEKLNQILYEMIVSHKSDDYFKFGNRLSPRMPQYAKFITDELKEFYPEYKFKTKFTMTNDSGTKGVITISTPVVKTKRVAIVGIERYGKNGTAEAVRGNLRFRLLELEQFE